MKKFVKKGETFMQKTVCLLLAVLLAGAAPVACGEERVAVCGAEELQEVAGVASAALWSVREVAETVSALPDADEGARAARIEALLRLAFPADEEVPYAVFGDVGDATLVRIDRGGDCVMVSNVYAGYRILSPTAGYPSETHLYLVYDDEIWTLEAAYRQGKIADMGAVYARLPEEFRGGYDPTAPDDYEHRGDFGFQNGVFAP